jgi:hypothetical protein
MTKATELREFGSHLTANTTSVSIDADVYIGGDLITTGNTINVVADTLNITDPNITLASGAANSAVADGAGITIDGADATLTYVANGDKFVFNKAPYYNSNRILTTADEPSFLRSDADDTATGYVDFSTGLRAGDIAIGGVNSTNTNYDVTIKTMDGNPLYLQPDNGDDVRIGGSGNPARLYVSGNVGVGYDSPNATLHVGGTASNIGSETNPAIQVGSSSNYRFGLYTTNEGAVFENKNGDDGITFLGKYAAGGVKVDKNGNLAIGSSFVGSNSVATHKLDVDGAIATRQVRHSIHPCLNLDFANSKQLDPRITFYRDSIATYYDCKGVLRYANVNEPRFDHDPDTGESKGLLIEEARTNTATYSEHPEKWTYTGYGTLTGFGEYYTAPDGVSSVRSMIFNNYSGTQSRRGSNQVSSTAGSTYTASFYIKNIYEGQNVAFYLGANSVPFNGLCGASIDFTLSSPAWNSGLFNNAQVVDAEVVDVGNGWYRAWIVATAFSTNTWNPVFVSGATTFEPEIAVWGMQVETGYFPTSYVPSDTRFTSRSSVATYHDENGILRTAPANSPRYGYKYDARKWVETGLILENAATNIATYSQDFTHSNWKKGDVTVQKTGPVSPDGYSISDTIIEGTGNGEHLVYNGNNTLGNNSTFALSVYLKNGTRRYAGIRNNAANSGAMVVFDLQEGTIVDTFASGNYSILSKGIEDVGNGWYRCFAVMSDGGDGYRELRIQLVNSSTPTYQNYSSVFYTGSSTIYAWGAQFEYGPTSSSYIQTYGSSVTRSADVASSVAYSRLEDTAVIDDNPFEEIFYNGGSSIPSGTVYCEYDLNGYVAGDYQCAWGITNGTASERIWQYAIGGSPNIQFIGSTDGVTNFSIIRSGTHALNQIYKTAATYGLNNYEFAVDGVSVGTDTVGEPSTKLDRFTIGTNLEGQYVLSGHVKKISYYSQQLSSAELQALTENN